MSPRNAWFIELEMYGIKDDENWTAGHPGEGWVRVYEAESALTQEQYDQLVRDAMQWRARFTAPDVVPRSRLDAVEIELATAEQRLKHVQEQAHKHITELESLFEHATGYSFDGYMRMIDEVKEKP